MYQREAVHKQLDNKKQRIRDLTITLGNQPKKEKTP